MSFISFMQEGIENADIILLICTPNYATKARRNEGGVGFEHHLISASVFSGRPRNSVIPIFRKGSARPGTGFALPPIALGIFYSDFRNDRKYSERVNELVHMIRETDLNGRYEARMNTRGTC
jgi:hypothetical protein